MQFSTILSWSLHPKRASLRGVAGSQEARRDGVHLDLCVWRTGIEPMFLHSREKDWGISYPPNPYHKLHYFPLKCFSLSPALSSWNRALVLLTFHLLTSLYSSVPSEIERGTVETAERISHSISGWNRSTEHWKSCAQFCTLWEQVNSFYSNIAETREVTDSNIKLQTPRTPWFINTILHFPSTPQLYKPCLPSDWKKILRGNKSKRTINYFIFF